MKFLYKIFIALYPKGITIASFFSKKAKLWIDGRKDIFAKMEIAFSGNSSPVIWFHCASLGEFEQGRPIMEAFKAAHPHYKILLTFFSPSGFEIRKNYKGANYIFYLPIDSRRNAQKFMEIVQPKIAIFVKYEFWFYYTQALHQRKIPLLLVSGIFRQGQVFFKQTGNFYRSILRNFTQFFVQNELSKSLLHSIQIDNITVAGDTRYDRVIDIAGQWSPVPYLETFCGSHPVFVAGSTWAEDESILKNYFQVHGNIQCIIAPHEIHEEHLKEIEEKFPKTIRYSQLSSHKNDLNLFQTVIIDNIGMLSKIYKYATVAYVGGAWGQKGIHNVLEAAVYGKPVLCGPHHSKSIEVEQLVDFGGAFSANDAHTLELRLNELFSDKTVCEKMSALAFQFVRENAGATSKINKYLNELVQDNSGK